MTLKINPIVATLLIAGIIILLFALFKGCQQSKINYAKYQKVDSLNTILLGAVKDEKSKADSIAKDYQDSLELERGQYELLKNQKERTEIALDNALEGNKELIAKHKLDKYIDTSAVTVPGAYVEDCDSCFAKLETTTNLTLRYKNDLNALEANWRKQNELYQKQFKALDQERLGFYNKVQTLAQQQQKELDKLKPHGRLYLSWGVIWGPLPKMAGAGLMYQNKYNLIWGAKWYYGAQGHMVETTINFPLSLKFK